jgi:hypothetical protein
MYRKKATMDTYDVVMEWYLRESSRLDERESFGSSPFFISRQKMMNASAERYNMEGKFAQTPTR